MTKDELKKELHLHWTVQFCARYGVGMQVVYNNLWQVGKCLRGTIRPKFPATDLTRKELRDIFYKAIDVKKQEKTVYEFTEASRIVENFKEDYVAPEPYEGRFQFAFNKF